MNTSRQAVTWAAAQRTTAIVAGAFYLITHVTSIGAAALYGPIQSNFTYQIGSVAEGQILMGVFFEVILAMANIGTAVALYPVVRRHNVGLAQGYVGLRTLEAAVIAIGVLPILVLVTLQRIAGTAGADPATLATLGNALVASHSWTMLLGPGLVCGVNTVVMASLLYRSGLVPRLIPTLGLIGGPLVFIINSGQLFGLYDQLPVWAAIAVIPIFAWEVSLALWLIVKGFRSPAVNREPNSVATNELLSEA